MNPSPHNSQLIGDDPLEVASRLAVRFNSLWKRTYPFARLGEGVSIHHSCDIERSAATGISIGNHVYFAPKVWLAVPSGENVGGPRITIGSGCAIGRRSTISAINEILLENDVLIAPSVLITDHGDGSSEGGRIVIEQNCWLGFGAAIVCEHGEIRLGRNSIVGANAVVTQSFPPYSIVVGNPARMVKMFDVQTGAWLKINEKAKKG
jgi:acetyltransferase-like isoleucine patch superfamily enzyme